MERCVLALVVVWMLVACSSPRLRRLEQAQDAQDAAVDAAGLDAGAQMPALGHLPVAKGCGGAATPGFDAGAWGDDPLAGELDAAAALGDADAAVVAGGGNSSMQVEPPPPTRAGQLVITEIMSDPKASSDTQGEWFELYNASDMTLSLRDCAALDGATKPHPFMTGPNLAPGAYATVARSGKPGFVPSVLAAFSLTNGTGQVAVACGGLEIDRVAYDKRDGFPIATGAAAQLDPHSLDAASNDVAGAWCVATLSYGADLGTPGRKNPSCSALQDADAGTP